MTDDPRVSLGLIVRDESANLGALLESVRRHVDEIVVVDTGSTDGTADIARQYADVVEVFLECNGEDGRMADFAMARNRCMDLCRHDWFLWLDGDDLVAGTGFHAVAAETPGGEPVAVLAPYEYEYAADGSPSCVLWRERMVWPRAEFVWSGPVHETLGRRDGRAVGLQTQAFVVKHRRQFLGKAPDPERNLRILARHVAGDGAEDVRSLHYLGTELAGLGRHGEALPRFRRAAELEAWDDARCQSLLGLARSQLALGDVEAAVAAASLAAQEKSWPEPYYVMHLARAEGARASGEQRDWARAAHFARIGLALEAERAPGLLPADPSEQARVRSSLLECLSRLGGHDVAALLPPLGSRSSGTPQERVLAALPECGLDEQTRRLVEVILRGEMRVDVRFERDVERPPVLPEHVLPALTPDMVGGTTA